MSDCTQSCTLHCPPDCKCRKNNEKVEISTFVKTMETENKVEFSLRKNGILLRPKKTSFLFDTKTQEWVPKDSETGKKISAELVKTVVKYKKEIIKYLTTNFKGESEDIYNLDKSIIVIRDVQAGKRGMAVEYMKQCITAGRSVIFFTSDYTSYVNRMKATVRENNINLCEVDIKNAQSVIEDLKKLPKVLCCNGNDSQMNRVLDIIKNSEQKINIIFDEVDDLVGESSKRGKIIKELVKTVNGRFIGFTATPFIIFWRKDILGLDIYGGDIIFKSSPVDHVKFGDPTFKVVISEHKFKQEGFMPKEDKDYLDHCIENSNSHKFDKGEVTGLLIVPGMETSVQEQIKNYLLEKYPDSFVVMANGDHDRVYNMKRDLNGTRHAKYVSDLPKTLRSIHDMWKPTDKYVFVLGRNKVGRSTSLRGELDSIPDSCHKMLMITNQIYCTSDIPDFSNIYQGGLRLQGVYPGEKPMLTLFTSKCAATKIKEYREQIQNTIEAYAEALDTLVQEGCPEVSNNFPKFEGKTIKPYTACKAPHKYYSFNDKIFPTLESRLKEQAENPNRPERKFTSTTCSKILQILRNSKTFMSAEQIYKSISKKDWCFTSSTPIASISSDCLRMFEGGLLNREKEGVLKYAIKE